MKDHPLPSAGGSYIRDEDGALKPNQTAKPAAKKPPVKGAKKEG
jgi:hypothetical protein